MSVLQTGIGPEKGFYPYAIDQSLRFNDDDSAYLTRSLVTISNRKTWTWSGWIKRGNLGFEQTFFGAYRDGNNYIAAQFDSDDTLNITYKNANQSGGSVASQIRRKITTQVFRDSSSWYHVVISFDASNTNCDIYVNGSEVTSFSVNEEPQNLNFEINNISTHYLSTFQNSTFTLDVTYFDGYLAEINFIDGQALDPTSFGEFKSGVWVANKYTGTYGTNGFYLPFENGLGDDESGNGNDWTPNNLAATDIVLDSPTNNFATLNPLDADGLTLSDGNLQGFGADATAAFSTSTIGMSSGKWYCEITLTAKSTSSSLNVGIIEEGNNQAYPDYGYFAFNGNKYDDLTGSAYGSSWDVGDVIGIAYDADTGTLTFYKNGVSQGDAFTGLSGTYFFCQARFGGADHTTQWNFGQDSSFAGNKPAQGNTDDNGIGDFYYTPPTDYLALSTANLPEPAISPADDASPSDYFNTVTYTGDGTSPHAITGVGHQPDFLWLKARSINYQHGLFTVLQGVNDYLQSNSTTAEVNDSTLLNSFDADGFTLGAGNAFNQSGQSYVAWNWKANGAGVTNTDGSITSTVSASPESGFSIVSYTGNGTAGATVGHGLDSAPEMVIVKSRSAPSASFSNWVVYHTSIGASRYIRLDTADAELDGFNQTPWGDTEPTGNVFTVEFDSGAGINGSGDDFIAYCFHSVEGYSKFGSYTGNGSADGPFVYTGFRPAFVMVKASSAGGAGYEWQMFDTARDISNDQTAFLKANLSDAESNGDPIDILSNGFKPRAGSARNNGSGVTYIYMAFAEDGGPFKFSNAR